jgi:hypothetical protein
MAKFHITTAGETVPCGATVRACPLGEAKHFDTVREAAMYGFSNSVNAQDKSAVSKKDGLFATLRKRGITTDFGNYDWDWVDSEDPADYDSQIDWLEEAEEEAEQDGHKTDATAYRQLRETVEESIPRVVTSMSIELASMFLAKAGSEHSFDNDDRAREALANHLEANHSDWYISSDQVSRVMYESIAARFLNSESA